jgi:ferredoxin-NADP reductase
MSRPDADTALVRSVRWESDGVVSLRLEPESGVVDWEPGAHIDVVVGDGTSRQYSLCGDPGDSDYRIAVLREPDGRGGSEFLHRRVFAGERLAVTGPRNHFALEEASALTLIAGGIGVTPLLPMARRLEREGRDWRLIYYGRDRSTMAFLGELAEFGDRVRIVAKSEGASVPVAEAFADRPADGLVYGCGPQRLLDDLRSLVPEERLRTELFVAPAALPVNPDSDTFTVELSASGLAVEVGPERSVLAAIASVGVEVTTDCEEGICGSCETRVLEGTLDHRDYVLTPQEKAANDCMMVCVSRAAAGCSRLVLDL